MKTPLYNKFTTHFRSSSLEEESCCLTAHWFDRLSPFLITFILLSSLWLVDSPLLADSQLPTVSTTSQHLANKEMSDVEISSEILVLSNSRPVEGAFVYRLSAGQTKGGEVLTNQDDEPLVTDFTGYLRGYSPLNVGDRLVALLPITTTNSYTLYQTSASPNSTGLEMDVVSTEGLLVLELSPSNPLLLFNLDVSLEWDARRDEIFLNDLKYDLERSSEILYDLTNGQIALGHVRVFHAKENWQDSHILIYASNNMHPSSALGGIVNGLVSETLSSTEVITDAYLPGQIYMSAIWNRFGNPNGEVGEDWPRTLAHELAHYLLFMPDNYLGLSEDKILTHLNCQGSVMTDPYRQDYSEFLTSEEWTGDCLDTLAQNTTGRSDWQTLKKFYPLLNADQINLGPTNLPINVTQISFIEPASPPNTLLDPFFNVTDSESNPLALPFGQAEGYLFKTQGTADVTDDELIPLGSPIADLLRVRGAEFGDRLCLFDDYIYPIGLSNSARRLGCVEEIGSSTNLSLHKVPGWQPQITVDTITSRTLAITVTQPITSGKLYLQILPLVYLTDTMTAPTATMNSVDANIFTQTITLDYPLFNGFIRLWAEEPPLREEISEFYLSPGWGGDTAGGRWGPSGNRYGWMAPVRNRNGEVIIFDLEHIFGRNPAYSLQALQMAPHLPPWLTQVGQAYRFSSADEITGRLNVMFEYMEREVPSGREDRLRIYYSPDEGQSWELLRPHLEEIRNLASAQMPGEGIYMLVSTIEIPLVGPDWNNFPYLAETKAVEDALASIDEAYNLVANYNPSRPQAWHLYDRTVQEDFAPLVNDLTQLEFEQVYWIYATENITLYLGSPVHFNSHEATFTPLQFPPALFYGPVSATTSFTPTIGMPVQAWVDGNLCGQTTIQEWNGELAYTMQVMAENISGQSNGCGLSGRQVIFKIGDRLMEEQSPWDNSQGHFYPLNRELVIQGSIIPQGRSAPPFGTLNVSVNLTLTLAGEDEPIHFFTLSTDDYGIFTLSEKIEPGIYDIEIKKETSLRKRETVALTAGLNEIDFGLLREGDANNDNVVTILDFSILAATFGQCSASLTFDERADFNGDGCLTILDFSLLASNFGQMGQ